MTNPAEQHSFFDSQRLESRRYYGKYPGVVTDNAPPAEGDHRGEIRVQVPGILEETPDGNGQQALDVLARPCFAPGFFFVPEIGTQVWVEFAAGDIDTPIWVGVWYSRDGVPLSSIEEAPTEFKKVYRSVAGHVVELDNTEGEEQVVIKHGSKTAITIDADGNIKIKHNGGAIVEIKDGNTIELTADTITATGEITLDGTVEITGETNIGANVNINGPLVVGSTTTTTIDGNQITGG
ncbi:MAG: hypothetical protein CSB13_09220 [Chloroflexi bacterium]|nr:MAG: hypothetical protein CSB13_09220 [Chloroflexota bacterium]